MDKPSLVLHILKDPQPLIGSPGGTVMFVKKRTIVYCRRSSQPKTHLICRDEKRRLMASKTRRHTPPAVHSDGIVFDRVTSELCSMSSFTETNSSASALSDGFDDVITT